ncbi:putative T7SS-secreted protein [Streptomyces sp. NPDC057555]|uniref:putative T7SS-secreted protein n=1 Tax=Streptomyces sp. NPDC057555 TaxID=3346166 RepID=UPI0036C2D471
MATRPGDWGALGLGGDPTPGDPAAINTIAGAMRDLADNAATINNGLRDLRNTAGDGQRFVGKTADALRDKVDEHLHNFVGHVEESFHKAEAALRAYANAVSSAQGEADQALSLIQGLADDDPQRQTHIDRANEARDALATAAGTLDKELTAAGQLMVQPVSDCDLFWEAFEWLTIIISVIAVFTGGILGILAWGMNAILLVKTIVDFSQGKASALQLGLAFLGVLFPTTKALPVGAIIKGVGNALKGGLSALAAGGKNILTQIGHFSVLSGLPKIVVAPLVIGAHLAPSFNVVAGIRGLGNLARGGWNKLVTTITKDWAQITGHVDGNWAKLGAYAQVNAVRLGRLTVAALLPLDATELGVLGFGGAARLAFAERVLGIPQPHLHDLLANAGRWEAGLNGGARAGLVRPGTLVPFHPTGLAGTHLPAGTLDLTVPGNFSVPGHLGTGTLNGPGRLPLGAPGAHLQTPPLGVHASLPAPGLHVQVPTAGLHLPPPTAGLHTQLPSFQLPTQTGTVGVHAATTSTGLHLPSGTPGAAVRPDGLSLPGVHGDAASAVHQLDFQFGHVRLDNNLLLPAPTAIDLLKDAHTGSPAGHLAPESMQLKAPEPMVGTGAVSGIGDGIAMARGAVGHAEALSDLTFPELHALASGDVAVTSFGADGIRLRIGDAAPRTVDAHAVAGTAPVGPPPRVDLPGAHGTTGAGHPTASPGTATPHLAPRQASVDAPHVTSSPQVSAAAPGPLTKDLAARGLTGTPAAVPTRSSRELAMELLGGADHRPTTGLSAAGPDHAAAGVSARPALDTAGTAGGTSAVDSALDLIAHPGAVTKAEPVPQLPHPDGTVGKGTEKALTGEPATARPPQPTGSPNGHPAGRPGGGPVTAPPGGRFGGPAAAVEMNQRLRLRHDLIVGGSTGPAAGRKLTAWVRYETALSDLARAERRVAELAPPPGGAGPVKPHPAMDEALDELGVRHTAVADAEEHLSELGVDPQRTRAQVQAVTGQLFGERGGLPGGGHQPTGAGTPHAPAPHPTPTGPAPHAHPVATAEHPTPTTPAEHPAHGVESTPSGGGTTEPGSGGGHPADALPPTPHDTATPPGAHDWSPEAHDPYALWHGAGDATGTGGPGRTMVNRAFGKLPDRGYHPLTPGDYLDWTKQSVEEGHPLAFVVNTIAPYHALAGGGLQRFLDSVTHGLEGFDGRVGVVIGVNGTAEQLEAVYRAMGEAMGGVRFDRPLALTAVTFTPKRDGGFPYGTVRNHTMTSPASRAMVHAFKDGAANGPSHPYFAFMDFDVYPHTVPGGRHVFDHFDEALTLGPGTDPLRPLGMLGGYRMPTPTGELVRFDGLEVDKSLEELLKQAKQRLETKVRNDMALPPTDPKKQHLDRHWPGGRVTFTQEHLDRFQSFVNADMRIRTTLSGIHPLLPYGPEPNLFVDALATMVDHQVAGREMIERYGVLSGNHADRVWKEIRFGGSSAEYKGLRETLNHFNAWELDQTLPPLPDNAELRKIAAANHTLPDRGVAFLTDFVAGATPTDLSRLMAGFFEKGMPKGAGALPQEHLTLKGVVDHAFGRDNFVDNPATVNSKDGLKIADTRTAVQNAWKAPRTRFADEPFKPMGLDRGASPLGGPFNESPWATIGRLEGLGEERNTLGLNISVRLPSNGPGLEVGIAQSERRFVAHALATAPEDVTFDRHLAYVLGDLLPHGGLPQDSLLRALPEQLTVDARGKRLPGAILDPHTLFADLKRQLGKDGVDGLLRSAHDRGLDGRALGLTLATGRLDPDLTALGRLQSERLTGRLDPQLSAAARARAELQREMLDRYARAFNRPLEITGANGSTFSVPLEGVRRPQPALDVTWHPHEGPGASGHWEVSLPDRTTAPGGTGPAPGPHPDTPGPRPSGSGRTTPPGPAEQPPGPRPAPPSGTSGTSTPSGTSGTSTSSGTSGDLVRQGPTGENLPAHDGLPGGAAHPVEPTVSAPAPSLHEPTLDTPDLTQHPHPEPVQDTPTPVMTETVEASLPTPEHPAPLPDEWLPGGAPLLPAGGADGPGRTVVNDAFRELTGHGHDAVTADAYLTWMKQSTEDSRPLAFVVNAIAPYHALAGGGLRDFLRSLTHGLEGFDGRVGVVIGVNGTAEELAAIHRAMSRALGKTTFDHPLALVATTFTPRRDGSFPYGTVRNHTMTSAASRAMVRSLAHGGASGPAHPYFAFMDFDVYAHTVPGGRHVFNHFDDALTVGPGIGPLRPLSMVGGYRVPSGAELEQLIHATNEKLVKAASAAAAEVRKGWDAAGAVGKVPKTYKNLLNDDLSPRTVDADDLERFRIVIDADMRIRTTLAGIHPLLPYGPEPNLFVDAFATLLDEVRLDGAPWHPVRFGKTAGEYKGLRDTLNHFHAWELDRTLPGDAALREIAAANHTLPDRGIAFVTDFVDGATPTDLSRLWAGYKEKGALPQEHLTTNEATKSTFGQDFFTGDPAGQQLQGQGDLPPMEAKQGLGLKEAREQIQTSWHDPVKGFENEPFKPVEVPGGADHVPAGGSPQETVDRFGSELAAAKAAKSKHKAPVPQPGNALGEAHNTFSLNVSTRIPGSDSPLAVGLAAKDKRFIAHAVAAASSEAHFARNLTYALADLLPHGRLPQDSLLHALPDGSGLTRAERATADVPDSRQLFERMRDRLRGEGGIEHRLHRAPLHDIDVRDLSLRLATGRLDPHLPDTPLERELRDLYACGFRANLTLRGVTGEVERVSAPGASRELFLTWHADDATGRGGHWEVSRTEPAPATPPAAHAPNGGPGGTGSGAPAPAPTGASGGTSAKDVPSGHDAPHGPAADRSADSLDLPSGRERDRAAEALVRGGDDGPLGDARLDAWTRYERARHDLARAAEQLERVGPGPNGAGPSGPTPHLLRAEDAYRDRGAELAHAEDELRDLGVDPHTVHQAITEANHRIAVERHHRGENPGLLGGASPHLQRESSPVSEVAGELDQMTVHSPEPADIEMSDIAGADAAGPTGGQHGPFGGQPAPGTPPDDLRLATELAWPARRVPGVGNVTAGEIFVNDAFRNLPRHGSGPLGQDAYRDWVRRSTTGQLPLSFVINVVVRHTDLAGPAGAQRLRAFLDAVLHDPQHSFDFHGRVGVVIGVNGSANAMADISAAMREALRGAGEGAGFPHPLALVGIGWTGSSFPFGTVRNAAMTSPAGRSLVHALMNGGTGGGRTHPYVAFMDFDPYDHLVPGGRHVFGHFEAKFRFGRSGAGAAPDRPAPLRPLMMAGGYRVPGSTSAMRDTLVAETNRHLAASELRVGAGDVPAFESRVQADMRARTGLAGIHPLLPYAPEPNLFVDAAATLLDDLPLWHSVRQNAPHEEFFRFGPNGAEFQNLSRALNSLNAWELNRSLPETLTADEVAAARAAAPHWKTPQAAEADAAADRLAQRRVHAANHTLPERGVAFVVDFEGAAIQTDLSRLMAGWRTPGIQLPQDHTGLQAMNQLYHDRSAKSGLDLKGHRKDHFSGSAAERYAQEPFKPLVSGPSDLPRTTAEEFGAGMGTEANQLALNVSAPVPGGDGLYVGVSPEDRKLAARVLALNSEAARFLQNMRAIAAGNPPLSSPLAAEIASRPPRGHFSGVTDTPRRYDGPTPPTPPDVSLFGALVRARNAQGGSLMPPALLQNLVERRFGSQLATERALTAARAEDVEWRDLFVALATGNHRPRGAAEFPVVPGGGAAGRAAVQQGAQRLALQYYADTMGRTITVVHPNGDTVPVVAARPTGRGLTFTWRPGSEHDGHQGHWGVTEDQDPPAKAKGKRKKPPVDELGADPRGGGGGSHRAKRPRAGGPEPSTGVRGEQHR